MSIPSDNNQHTARSTSLSIVILNWNVASLLADCLRSLPAAAGDWWPRTEVIIVDNASTDSSLDVVRVHFPHVRLLALTENVGFSAGNNAGIRASAGRYIFLLNPDTLCHPGSISRMCDYMEEHPEVGIAGPRLLNPDGTLQPSRRRFPTLATALVESTPLQSSFANAFFLRRFYMLDRPDNEPQPVGWLSGAALLCRRETLLQIGLLDPGFFMFSEEVDLCRRATDAGWQIVYLPRSEITHYGGQSTEQAIPSRHIDFNTGKARYFSKHEGRFIGNLVRLYLLAVYAAQSLSEVAKWLLGHKRPLRAARLRAYSKLLGSGLRPHRRYRSPANSPVLLITGEFPPAHGGVGDYTCHLSKALSAGGTPNRVLTRFHEGINLSNGHSSPTAFCPTLRAGSITLRATLRAVRGTHASLAHIQYQTGAYEMRPTVNFLPLLLKLIGDVPTVVTFHDLLVPYLFPKAGPLREWSNRLLARTAVAVVATNPTDAARLRSWGVRHVEMIPIGSNIPDDPPPGYDPKAWRASHDVAPGTVLLAYFGFLNSTKGLDDLLHALSLLRASPADGLNYRLMMVGGGLGSSDPTNRATAARLNDIAATLGVAELLLWTGYLSPREVSAALLAADMAVLPYADGASFRRGSLMAILEHGLPVITTSVTAGSRGAATATHVPNSATSSDMPDDLTLGSAWPTLQDGTNALLVPPGDSLALARAIERLADDPHFRATLSAGSRRLSQFFGWERIAQMHKTLYDTYAPEKSP